MSKKFYLMMSVAQMAAAVSAHAQTPEPTAVPPVAAAPAAPEAGNALTMHLICKGTGERKVVMGASGFAFGSTGQSAWGFGTRQNLSQFNEQMDIDIVNGKARARVPRRFLPALHGGDGGWFDVQDFSVAENEITGKVAINFTNHPNLRIDRRSGSVALDGKVGAFAGQCEKFNPEQKAF